MWKAAGAPTEPAAPITVTFTFPPLVNWIDVAAAVEPALGA